MRKITVLFLTMILAFLVACEIEPEIYTVTFNTNGGSSIEVVEVDEGSTISEPTTPTKEGHTFLGWFSDTSLLVAYDFASPVLGDLTLNADFEVNEYTVSFMDEGSVLSTLDLDYMEDIAFPSMEKEGHTFGGWYTDEDLTTAFTETTMPSNDLTLYPNWLTNEYTLSFFDFDESLIIELDVIYDTDLSTVDYPTPVVVTGHTFVGWDPDTSYMPADDLAIYAEYQVNTYSITYNYNGVTEVVNYEYNEELELLLPGNLVPEYEGWFTDASLTTPFTDTQMPASDIVLYGIFAEALINVLDELPNEQITIEFWHVYGTSKGDLLDSMIDEFEAMYPNVTVNATMKGNYYDLLNQNKLAISAGVAPTITLGYGGDFAEYNMANAVVPLDDFILHPTHGVPILDFNLSYLLENAQNPLNLMYSMPFSKSTEVMFLNKTMYETNGITYPTDRPITYAELDVYAETLVGTGTNQSDYLISWDSPANYFIMNSYMFGAPYTSYTGDVLIDNSVTRDMMTYASTRFTDKTFAFPIAWNEVYGSNTFKSENVSMLVGSTAGVKYNIPNPGTFEMDVLPVPQYDLNNKAVIQQGPNIGILSNSTDAERLAAWLLIEYLTNTENTAKWAILTGYLPVRYSAINSDLYQEFLSIHTLDNPYTHTFSSELLEIMASPQDGYYESLTADVALSQYEYMLFEPSFVNIGYSSSDVRVQAGIAMEVLFIGNGTNDEIIAEFLYQLGLS